MIVDEYLLTVITAVQNSSEVKIQPVVTGILDGYTPVFGSKFHE
jgi:hypothetical protein